MAKHDPWLPRPKPTWNGTIWEPLEMWNGGKPGTWPLGVTGAIFPTPKYQCGATIDFMSTHGSAGYRAGVLCWLQIEHIDWTGTWPENVEPPTFFTYPPGHIIYGGRGNWMHGHWCEVRETEIIG